MRSAQASDGRGGTSSATFNVNVRPVNDAPRFVSTSVTVVEDASPTIVQLEVSDPEGDDIEKIVVSDVSHGSLLYGDLYQPDANFSGTDTFVAKLKDKHGAVSADTTISIVVTPVNDGPVAADDQFLYTSGSAPLEVLANDSDVDGDALLVSIVESPNIGTASVADNRVVYEPPANYMGPATFRYRIADGSGAFADATARLVVGEFPRVLLLDTIGNSNGNLSVYDGLLARFISMEGPQRQTTDYGIWRYTTPQDGRHLLYLERVSQSDTGTLTLFDLARPRDAGNPNYLHPFRPGSYNTFELVANRDASYGLRFIESAFAFEPTIYSLVRTVPYSAVGLGVAANVFPLRGVFNPVSDEFYVMANVSTATPPAKNTSTFSTLFAGSISNPVLTQIGASYAPGIGAGSGLNVRITPNGRYVLHAAINAPTVGSLLVNDRSTNTETDLYRAFVAGEFASPNEFDVNADGSRVCLRVNAPGSTGNGPGRIWTADPATPGAAVPVTPVTAQNQGCRWAADGRTIAYLSADGGAPLELWQVDTLAPNAVTRSREPLAAGETTAFWAVAEKSMTAVVGVTPPGSTIPHFYRIALDSPGSSTRFASPGIPVDAASFTLDPRGDWLAYIKADPASGTSQPVRRLHLASTRIADFDMVVPFPTGANPSISEFQFLRTP